MSDYDHVRGCYLDYAGAGVYSRTQMEAVHDGLMRGTCSNPHTFADDSIEAVRLRVLEFVGCDPLRYDVVFTRSATDALRLLSSSLPFDASSRFLYSRDNHTSVLGIRGPVLAHNGKSIPFNAPYIAANTASTCLTEMSNGLNLIAVPSMSNATGALIDVDEVVRAARARDEGALVLVDVAAHVAHARVSVERWAADFAVMSFYKIFGFPTGVGALVVRRAVAHLLRPAYYGGGAVAAVSAEEPWAVPRAATPSRLEVGTPPFLEIAALPAGFDQMDRVGGVDCVGIRACRLRERLATALRSMPGVRVLGPEGARFGPIVAFSVDGIGHSEVVTSARTAGIVLRGGCFCNVGACAEALGLSHADLAANYAAGHECWDGVDMVGGRHTGAVRASFGVASTDSDVDTLLAFLSSVRLRETPTTETPAAPRECVLQRIVIYPVKSCRGQEVSSWPVRSGRLLWDRQWMITSPGGEPLSSKAVPLLARVCPTVREDGRLQLAFDGDASLDAIEVAAAHGDEYVPSGVRTGLLRAAGAAVRAHDSPAVCAWLERALGRPCRLVHSPGPSLANVAPLLAVSVDSVASLAARLPCPAAADWRRFRPNLLLRLGAPFAEDALLGHVLVGPVRLRVTSSCSRCAAVSIDPQSGVSTPEPLETLRSFRKGVFPHSNSISFGVYCTIESDVSIERDGDATENGTLSTNSIEVRLSTNSVFQSCTQ